MKLIALILAILLLSAWNWPTHKDFAKKVYEGFPEGFRKNLDVSLIEEGSIIPDKVFMDYRNHSYPGSVPNAEYWLEKSVSDYKAGNYNNASIEFGIASHYISDSFSSPHNVNGEDYSDHSSFETEAERMPFFAKCAKGNMNIDFYIAKGTETGKDWKPWLSGKNRNIQSKELSKALESAHSIYHSYFNEECSIKLWDIIVWRIKLWNFRSF